MLSAKGASNANRNNYHNIAHALMRKRGSFAFQCVCILYVMCTYTYVLLVHRCEAVNVGTSRSIVRLIRVRLSEKMKRSPLNNAAHGGRPYGARHTPYNWKSHENACGRNYQPTEGNSYQHFPGNNTGSQPRDDNFIPLNVSTPMTRHEKYTTANRYSPSGGRGSPSNGWYNNYRSNYQATPKSNNKNPVYKHSPKSFQYMQKRKGYKGVHRQMNVSAYVDMNSFLEDPWEDLVKKLNDSKDTSKSEAPENKSLSNSKLVDSDLLGKSKSQLSKNTNLDDLQCSQQNRNEYSVDTTFETNTDLSQISKINSLIDSETRDVCSDQDSLNENMCCISDKICGAIRENSIHSNVSLTDIKQKAI